MSPEYSHHPAALQRVTHYGAGNFASEMRWRGIHAEKQRVIHFIMTYNRRACDAPRVSISFPKHIEKP